MQEQPAALLPADPFKVVPRKQSNRQSHCVIGTRRIAASKAAVATAYVGFGTRITDCTIGGTTGTERTFTSMPLRGRSTESMASEMFFASAPPLLTK